MSASCKVSYTLLTPKWGVPVPLMLRVIVLKPKSQGSLEGLDKEGSTSGPKCSGQAGQCQKRQAPFSKLSHPLRQGPSSLGLPIPTCSGYIRPHRHPKLKLLLYFLNNWLSIYKHREPERKVNERMDYKPGFRVACLPDQGLYEQLPMKFPALPILPGISREPEKSRPARTSSLPAGGSTYGSQEQTLIPDSLQRHGQPCWSVPEPQHKVSHNTKN